jgi:energy-converting hydrogenase B subunit D
MPRDHGRSGAAAMTVLQLIALVGVMLGGLAVVLTGDPLRQTMVLGVFGISLTFLFMTYQAPDVALSEIVVTSLGLPLIILAALRKIRQQHLAREQEQDRGEPDSSGQSKP